MWIEDAQGNGVENNHWVRIVDDTPPVLTCPADITIIAAPGACSAPAVYAATASDNCGNSSISYSPPSGSNIAIGTTTVLVTATDQSGLTTQCSFSVVVAATPVDLEYASSSICQNAQPILPTIASPTGGAFSDANQAGTINPVTGEFNPSVATPGLHTLGYVFAGGCTSHDWFTIEVVAEADAGSNGMLSICSNGTTQSLFAELGGTPNGGGFWNPSLVFGDSYDPATMDPGVYTYTVNGTGPCANASASVTVNEIPVLTAGDDNSATICAGSNIDLSTLLSGADAGGTWSSGPVVSTAGTYTYTVSNGCGTDVASFTLNMTPILSAGTDNSATICAGSSVDLSTLLSGADTGGTWSSGPVVSTAGTYTYTVSNGCGTDVASFTVIVTLLPSAGDDGSTTICSGLSVDLDTLLSGNTMVGTWSGGSNIVSPISSTGYNYVVTNGCGNDAALILVNVTATDTTVVNVSACESYTWAVNGVTYSSGGSYAHVLECHTEILVLSITVPATPCDDGNPNTGNDIYDANCNCAGQLIDCLGVPGGTALVGTACDDGNALTGNDIYDANCICAGQLIDCLGVPGGSALVGTACDDGNALTGNDIYDANCICAGQLIDCLGVPGGSALVGTACDDGNPNTGNDIYDANCNCAGQLIDCLGVPGGSALVGTACDDSNALTGNDIYDANCNCAGQLIDCLGVPGGSSLVGTACDDGNALTGNDVYDANCICAGQLIDCLGLPGGSALVGTACDDGNPNTGNDIYGANCNCAGQLIDCLGVPGGTALVGTACDDGNALTGNDIYDANCICAGQLIDCLGVPGGTALVGTACDDGNPTGNDIYDANCICAGQLIDCLCARRFCAGRNGL
ncbi:MAG: HYR domain-containing protein [Flavobacteriales bacterium]|nr:HYR domain-containing protein [Flavobacteriales bacterium]